MLTTNQVISMATFSPTTNKMLVGSGSQCDWRIDHSGVSQIHALIYFQGDSWWIMDLASDEGVFVNGERIHKIAIQSLDEVMFGAFSFIFKPTLSLDNNEIKNITPECEWKVDESFVQAIFPDKLDLNNDNVTSIDDFQESLELTQSIEKTQLELMVYSSGSLISIDYIPWPTQEINFSHNIKNGYVFFPGITTDIKITLDPSNKKVIKADSFEYFKEFSLTDGANHFLTLGLHQLSLRLVNKSYSQKMLPWWSREREYYKTLTSRSFLMFLPFLLLLLVSIPEVKEEEEVTIVYKELPPELKKEEKVEESETVQKEQKQEIAKADVVVKDTRKIVESKASSQTEAPVVKKSFTFKATSAAAQASVVEGTVAIDSQKANTAQTMNSGAVANAGSLSNSSMGPRGNTNGFDMSGSGSTSVGARGLVAKKGFSNSYIEPKTVVLGSMDPELLRKILQEYIPQFQHCYQQELARQGDDVKGVIDLNFTIGEGGKVVKTNIKAKDARFSTKGIGCMNTVLSMIPFPSPKGGGIVDVKQPLNFFAETEKI